MSKISDYKPQDKNANKHTQRGMGLLEKSIRTDGFIGAMTAANDGEIIAGSARLEKSAEVYGIDSDAIVIETDGTKPIIVKRTDIPDANDDRARRLAIADNRIQEIDLDWDTDMLQEMLATDGDGSEPALDLHEWWNDKELGEMGLQVGEEPPADPGPQIDRAEELREKWGVETGQLWRLGEHKLFCGSADRAGIECKLAIYDPPFDWSWQQQDNTLSWVRWETAVLMGHEACMPLVQRGDFEHWWIWDSKTAARSSPGYHPTKTCDIILVFGDKRNLSHERGLRYLAPLGIASDYKQVPMVISIVRSYQYRREAMNFMAKPIQLLEYMIELYSIVGDEIGEPFAGTGSGLLAVRTWVENGTVPR